MRFWYFLPLCKIQQHACPQHDHKKLIPSEMRLSDVYIMKLKKHALTWFSRSIKNQYHQQQWDVLVHLIPTTIIRSREMFIPDETAVQTLATISHVQLVNGRFNQIYISLRFLWQLIMVSTVSDVQLVNGRFNHIYSSHIVVLFQFSKNLYLSHLVIHFFDNQLWVKPRWANVFMNEIAGSFGDR